MGNGENKGRKENNDDMNAISQMIIEDVLNENDEEEFMKEFGITEEKPEQEPEQEPNDEKDQAIQEMELKSILNQMVYQYFDIARVSQSIYLQTLKRLQQQHQEEVSISLEEMKEQLRKRKEHHLQSRLHRYQEHQLIACETLKHYYHEEFEQWKQEKEQYNQQLFVVYPLNRVNRRKIELFISLSPQVSILLSWANKREAIKTSCGPFIRSII